MGFLGLSLEHPGCGKPQGSTGIKGTESVLVLGMLVVEPLVVLPGL